MKSPLKKYVILASILTLLWAVLLVYIYLKITKLDTIISQEIQANSREIAQQSKDIFTWFNDRQEVYVKTPQSKAYNLPPEAEISTLDGRILTMAVPLEVIKKLETTFKHGITVRFASSSPLNSAHIPKTEDNDAMMTMMTEGKEEHFSFYEEKNSYHYTYPIFAQKSCLTCHTNMQTGDLLGALVVETNPTEYILRTRHDRVTLFLTGFVGSSLTIFFFYLLIVHIWRKYRAQRENLEYAKSMVENMSHGTEMIISNVERIINELAQGTHDPAKAELLRTLQYLSEDLLQSSQALATGSQAQIASKEELIHVDTFFRQCVQLFHGQCLEKDIELTLVIDPSVPIHVLGDAFHLRQVLSMLLKNAITNTHTGGIRVHIDSAIDIASHFSVKDLQHTPIHLLVEIADTSKGYIITDQQHVLQNFSSQQGKNIYTDRAVIDLRPISEIAMVLNGGITVPQNGKTGATFLATMQVKMVDEAEAKQHAPISNPIQPSAKIADAVPPTAKKLDTVSSSAPTANIASLMPTQSTPQAATAQAPAAQALTTTQQTTPSAPADPLTASAPHASAMPTPLPASASSPAQAKEPVPQLPHNVRAEGPTLPQSIPQIDNDKPILAIIGDCNVQELTQSEKDILSQANIQITLVDSGTNLFEMLDNSTHGYSVVLLRELSDMDTTYAATRIRYLESLGSTPVAVVLIAEDMVQGDMDVLRFFNVSTVDNFPRDAHIASQVINIALRTKNNQIFIGGQFFNKTNTQGDATQIFDVKASLENSKKDLQFIHSICTMWIRFYPEQVRRLRETIKNGTQDEKLRVMRAIRNSASTVSLPMLWAEATRLEGKIAQDAENVRYEKLFSIYEQTFEHLKASLKEIK